MQKCLLFLLLFTSEALFSQVNDKAAEVNDQVSQSSGPSLTTTQEYKQVHSILHLSDQKVYILNPVLEHVQAKWEFQVEHTSTPSSQDQARIYLLCDKDDFSESLNGYFVQIDEGNKGYSFHLYRQRGSTITRIITGSLKSFAANTRWKSRLQVTRDHDNTWQLKIAPTDQPEYSLEGSTTDSTFTSGSYFGTLCKYTTVNSAPFIFSNINISSAAPSDHEPPLITSVTAIDSTTLEVRFNESVDSASAHQVMSYSLSNSYGNPIAISSTNSTIVFHLKFNKNLLSGEYVLSVSGIKDLNNNPIAVNTSVSFTYRKPVYAAKGDLIINEIFADPTPQVDLPSVEFAEIFNTATYPISLKGWQYSDPAVIANLPDTQIGPGEYVILCAKADTNEYKQFGPVIGISPWPVLNNTSDILKITSPEGLTIDSVSYTDTWYQSTVKKQGGWSLEKIDPESACQGIFNWAASNDPSGGTPGRLNSVYQKDFDQLALKVDSVRQASDTIVTLFFNKPLSGAVQVTQFLTIPSTEIRMVRASSDGKQTSLIYASPLQGNTTYELSINGIVDCAGNSFSTGSKPLTFKTKSGPIIPPDRIDTAQIFISEIFADPSPEVGLPLVEFIELYNPGLHTVNLDGWTLSDMATKGTLKNKEILPGKYLILCPLADTLAFKPFGRVVGLSPWPALNNASDQVTLKSHTNRLVDSIAYSDTWYHDKRKQQGGWTLERVFNDNTCNGFYNWQASKAEIGGTPGAVNSVFQSIREFKIEAVTVLSDSTLNLTFNTIPDTSDIQASFFHLNQGIGNAEAFAFNTEDRTEVKLTFSRPLTDGLEYTLTINSLKSCSNQFIDKPYSFKTEEIPHYRYPIVINEIFADPSPVIGIPEAEFVELHNPTEEAVDLTGLIYEDSSKSSYQFTSGSIEAKGYLILCARKDTLSLKPFGKVIGINPWPVLNNDKDVLVLKDNKGYEIHRVSYTDAWYKDKEKQQGGYSLELINPSSVCSGIQNWTSSKDASGGTPGRANSVYSDTEEVPALALLNAGLADSLSITLTFNQSVDSLSASNTANYSINNGLNNPASATPVAPDFDKVTLRFAAAISRGKTYRITVNNIVDCTGQAIALNAAEFTYAEKIEKMDVIINEVLFNPRPNGADFVEIYNPSTKVLDMKELMLATNNEKDSIIQSRPVSESTLLLEPDHYLVLTPDPNNIKMEYVSAAPLAFQQLKTFPSFNDKSGVVIIMSGTTRIDQLNYSEKMHNPLIKDPEGVSLERVSATMATNEPGNFRSAAASVGYATPGYKNSQYLDLSESDEVIELVSKTFSPDNDGFEDALVLNYRFPEAGMIANVSIYNDQGALIKKLVRNYSLAAEGILTWDGMNEVNEISPVGIYLIYLEVFDLKGTVKKYRKNFVLAAKLN